MTENSTPTTTGDKPRSWRNFFRGGIKRWLVLGPVAILALWAVFFFAQPLIAFAWQYMPILVFAGAVTLGLTFTRLNRGLKIASGIAAGAITGGLLYSYGATVAPFVGICLGGAALLALCPRLPHLLNLCVKTGLGLAGLWLILVNTVPAIQQWQLAAYVVESTEELDEFPVSIDDRVLARATALEYALKSNDDRTKEVERIHILWLPEGTATTLESTDEKTVQKSTKQRCVWQAPLKFNPEITANKFWYSFWGSTEGVIRVDGSEMNRKVDHTSGDGAFFMFGAESWVTETIFKLRHPLSTIGEKLYWQKPDGSWSLLVSYISYKPTWTGTMIPVLNGVMEFGTHGSFVNHSPAEAKKLFPGATLFPGTLANKYGEAYARFRYGLDDYFWTQKGLLEISEDNNAKDVYPYHNSHPYYQNFEKYGPQLVLPFEPAGDKADALTHVLLFDAVDGSIKGYNRPAGNTITGPRTGLQNLKEAAPELNWASYASVEPLIIHTKENKWLYKVSIITDGVGHATVRIIVVDAETLFPVAFDNVKDYRRYIETGKLPQGFRAHPKAGAPADANAPQPASPPAGGK